MPSNSSTTSFRIGTIDIVPNDAARTTVLSFSVQVTDSDGDTTSTALDFTLENPYLAPIVIDMDGDGVEFRGV